jgi:chromosome segregation ATPase
VSEHPPPVSEEEIQRLIEALRMNAQKYQDYCVRDLLSKAVDALASLPRQLAHLRLALAEESGYTRRLTRQLAERERERDTAAAELAKWLDRANEYAEEVEALTRQLAEAHRQKDEAIDEVWDDVLKAVQQERARLRAAVEAIVIQHTGGAVTVIDRADVLRLLEDTRS